MDLKTSYMGLELINPLVPGASPLTADVESCKQLEDAGAAALVLPSLFQEQIMHESEELSRRMLEGTDSFSEALTYFPNFEEGFMGPESYLEHIRKVKEEEPIAIRDILALESKDFTAEKNRRAYALASVFVGFLLKGEGGKYRRRFWDYVAEERAPGPVDRGAFERVFNAPVESLAPAFQRFATERLFN